MRYRATCASLEVAYLGAWSIASSFVRVAIARRSKQVYPTFVILWLYVKGLLIFTGILGIPAPYILSLKNEKDTTSGEHLIFLHVIGRLLHDAPVYLEELCMVRLWDLGGDGRCANYRSSYFTLSNPSLTRKRKEDRSIHAELKSKDNTAAKDTKAVVTSINRKSTLGNHHGHTALFL